MIFFVSVIKAAFEKDVFLSIISFFSLNKMPSEKLVDENFKLFGCCKKMLHLLLSCDTNRNLSTLQPPNFKKSKKHYHHVGLNFFSYFPSSLPSSSPLTMYVFRDQGFVILSLPFLEISVEPLLNVGPYFMSVF